MSTGPRSPTGAWATSSGADRPSIRSVEHPWPRPGGRVLRERAVRRCRRDPGIRFSIDLVPRHSRRRRLARLRRERIHWPPGLERRRMPPRRSEGPGTRPRRGAAAEASWEGDARLKRPVADRPQDIQIPKPDVTGGGRGTAPSARRALDGKNRPERDHSSPRQEEERSPGPGLRARPLGGRPPVPDAVGAGRAHAGVPDGRGAADQAEFRRRGHRDGSGRADGDRGCTGARPR